MKDFVQHIKGVFLQKGVLVDTVAVTGGTGVSIAEFLTQGVPMIIKILTIVILVWRVLIARQEYKLNKRELEKRD